MAEIIVNFGGSMVGKYVFKKGEMIIGRTHDNDIVLENLAVSRKHARLSAEGGRFFLTDLDSGNGTFVNGVKITKTELRHDDEIVIGKHTLVFKNPIADQALVSDVFGAEPTRLVGRAHVGYVEVLQGKQKDMQFRIYKAQATIGCDRTCDIMLGDRGVAKQHAVIRREGDRYFIRHTARWHRTVVNGMVVEEAALKEGDEIQMGSTLLVFGISQEEVPPGMESKPS